MTVRELLQQIRDTLQDTDKVYWSESELINLYNDGRRYMVSERGEETSTIVVSLLSTTNDYTVDGVLRYISAKDNNGNVRNLYPDNGSGDLDSSGVIVKAYNSIYVNEPITGESLIIRCIAIPTEDNLNDNVRAGDEQALKNYVLSKSYEKENDMENFQKSQYFYSKFLSDFKTIKKNTFVGYVNQTQTTKGYYF